MRRKQRFLVVWTTVLVLFSVSTVSTFAASVKAPLSIHYLTARSEDEAVIKALKDIAAEWKKTNPGFTFEVESIPDRASYLQKLKILAASNELPEWFESDPDTFFASLVKKNMVYNIEDLYKELKVSDRFFSISKEYARLPESGNLSLITWQCNCEYFFYNKDMFAKAGIKSKPRTMDELLAACAKLKTAGFTPIATVSGDWPVLRYFAMVPFRLSGNDYIINATQGKVSFGNDVGIAGAKFMQKISQYFQVGFSSADYDTMVDLFVGNHAAMLYNGTWVLPELVDKNGDLKPNIGCFTMPTYSSHDATPATDFFANSGIGTAVRRDKMTDQMKSFLAFVFDRYPDICLKKYNTLPSISPASIDTLSPLYKSILKDIKGVKTYAKCWDVVIDSASLETLNKATTELCLNRITPEEWASRMDKIVAENHK